MALRLAVFASGGGSNFRAILDGAGAYLPVLLVTSRLEAGARSIAKAHGVAEHVLDPDSYAEESAYVEDLCQVLSAHEVEFIALAGYLRKVPSAIVHRFNNRMLNIHPALLPRFGGKGFYGMRVHRAVLNAGEAESGATVHFVDEAYDTGPILLQERVPVRTGDTPERLARRVLRTEHRIYPQALNLVAQGRVRIHGAKSPFVHSHRHDHRSPDSRHCAGPGTPQAGIAVGF